MGAAVVWQRAWGKSAREAFDELCEKAERMYGDDEYNGQINNRNLCACLARFEKCNDESRKKAAAIIKKYFNDEKDEKRRVDYIDVGVFGYKVLNVKKKNNAYTAKYRQKFVIECVDFDSPIRVREYLDKNAFDTKTEADKRAAELSLKTGGTFCVKKKMVRLEGNDIVTEISCDVKWTQKKPTKGNYHEIHEYEFFGSAPE